MNAQVGQLDRGDHVPQVVVLVLSEGTLEHKWIYV